MNEKGTGILIDSKDADIILVLKDGDIVETGNTLKANGLEVLKYFMDFSARMICNPVSFKMKYDEIQQLMEVIREHSMKA